MRGTVSGELARSQQSLVQALKVVPAVDSQRHVCVLGGSLGIEAMRMDEQEVASGCAYQQERRLTCSCANRREQLGQQPKDGSIR